ncbi:MAG: NADH-quinone oxidoreductase subunit N [Chloroflexota bacterium]
MFGPDLIATLPLLILAGWSCGLLLQDVFLPARRRGLTPLLAALGLLASMVPLVMGFGRSQTAFGGMIVADGFASFVGLLTLAVGLGGIALAYDYIRRMGIERGEYYSLLLFSLTGIVLMAYAGDLIIVFLALELLSIPLYVLSGFAVPRLESEEAGLKYFLLGAFASGFVLYGIALTFGATGTTRLSQIVEAIGTGVESPGLLAMGLGLILVGLGFKVAAVPFHMWTPDVYHGAPSAVVGFMSAGAKVGGFAALLRVLLSAFPGLAGTWATAAAVVAALTMIWGNVAAIAQPGIKRLLAYSSIAHAGYLLMALASSTRPEFGAQAVSAALYYLVAYAITNLGAWAVVVAMEKAEGGGTELEDYAGLASRRPGLALAMAVFMLSFTGVPPTIGFLGKFYLFRATLDAGQVWLALVGVLTSLVSAYYYLRVVVMMFMRPGAPITRSESWLNLTVGLTALGTVAFGILPGPLLALAGRAGLFTALP